MNLKLRRIFWISLFFCISSCRTAHEDSTGTLTATPSTATGPVEVKVMTYNIAAPKKPDLEVIAAEINAARADLVGLQEVDKLTLRNFKDMAAELGRKTKMHVIFADARWLMAGRTGNAILSRWPIATHEVVRFPHVDTIADPDKICTSKYREQRIAILSTIKLPSGKSIQFATAHFGHCVLEQQAAVEALKEKLSATKPFILVGDFNANQVLKNGATGKTAKAFTEIGLKEAQADPAQDLPQSLSQRIDWILFNECWEAKDFAIGKISVSDHSPVMANLRLLSNCN